MTIEDDPRQKDEDAFLAELFAELKQVQPTLAGQVRNRTTVAGELARLSKAMAPDRPWWSLVKTLAPFVLGVGVGVVAMLPFTAPRVDNVPHGPQSPVQVVPDKDQDVSPQDRSPSRSPAKEPVFDLYVTNTYLCGFGELNSTSRYVKREANQ